MSSFLGKIASAFVEIEEEPQQQPQVAPQQSSTVLMNSINTNGTPAPSTASKPENMPALSEELVNKLCARLEQVSVAKPDYLEFKQSMTDPEMITSIPSEISRMQIVFKVLKAGSSEFSKNVLTSSIDTYLGYLTTWEADAKNEMAAKRAELDNKMRKIEDLQKQIEQLTQEKLILSNEVAETQTRIAKQDADFAAAVSYIRQEFTADREKIVANIK